MDQEKAVPHQSNQVLAIDSGSTSTKFGVFTRKGGEWLELGGELFCGPSLLARTGYRAAWTERAPAAAGCDQKQFAAWADGRVSTANRTCGIFLIDGQWSKSDASDLRGEHTSKLGVVIAPRFATVEAWRIAHGPGSPTCRRWPEASFASSM